MDWNAPNHHRTFVMAKTAKATHLQRLMHFVTKDLC